MSQDSREAVTLAASDDPRAAFGADELADAFRNRGTAVARETLDTGTGADTGAGSGAALTIRADGDCPAESFRIETDPIRIVGGDPTGAMYGALELAETVRAGGRGAVAPVERTPEVDFRAVKFNLPWDPYRDGAETAVHLDTCRDRDFWRAFLDSMARNRLNALTLWNLHPFAYLVRTEEFPEACPVDDAELADWQDFWHDLFRMAAERGIDTYLLNWNVVVPESFAEAHGVDRFNSRAEVVEDYTREAVRAAVDEYPNLTGLGVSLCDWMDGFSPAEKQAWLDRTIIEGIRGADRSVEFLNRSVLTESIDEMREQVRSVAAADNVSRVLVPCKFNWSHGHSSTRLELTHDYSTGEVDDGLWNPAPEDYEVVWTVRNEDFNLLRWGDPGFVREHVAANTQDYVGGYIVGSEGFIPAADYGHDAPRHRDWTYDFQRQWLFYAVWGRLLYDPGTPDRHLARLFEARHDTDRGDDLLAAYARASEMPVELASLWAGTWDYTLYSEGFAAESPALGLDDGASPLISVDELVDHRTLDSRYVSVADFAAGGDAGAEREEEKRVTPPEIADRMEANADAIRETVTDVRADAGSYPGALTCELLDLEAWAGLSAYFAAKLRGAVALERFRAGGDPAERERAIECLERARDRWNRVVDVTERHYREIPYAQDHFPGETFSWAKYREAVERDVAIAREATPR
jgi:hypothetical protein